MKLADYNACVVRYTDTVYRIAFHSTGTREDAEDITQEVFLKLYHQDRSWSSEEEIKAWLIRVTINTGHSLFRNPFVKRRTELPEEAWEKIPGADSQEERLLTHKTVIDAVMALPPQYRIIIYLYYYEEYSVAQISEIMQIKPTTIQTRLARARAKLKTALADSFPEKGAHDGI